MTDASVTDELLARIFDPHLTMLRCGGAWIRDGDYAGFPLTRPSLAALPWTHGHPVRIDLATGNSDLAGYPPIEPVVHLVDQPSWRAGSVLVPVPVEGVEPATTDVTYEDARDELRRALPGVTDGWLDALLLLVVAGLRAQLALPEPPLVIIEMPSGSGKGALLAAASGVLGVHAQQISLDGDGEETQRSIGTALETRAPIVWCDEVGKVSGFFRKSAALLKLSRVYKYRALYIGDTVTPVRSAVVLVGSTVPPGMLTMQELDRRGVLTSWEPIPARTTARWPASVGRAFGVGGLQDLRQSATGATIAHAFVEEARRLLAAETLPPWPEQAITLGASRIRESNDMTELVDLARDLYRIWTDPTEDAAACVWEGRPYGGWLRCWHLGRGDLAADLISEWVDEDAPSRERWGRVVGPLSTVPLTDTVGVAVQARGKRLWVRFVAAANARSLERLDRDLFPPLENA